MMSVNITKRYYYYFTFILQYIEILNGAIKMIEFQSKRKYCVFLSIILLNKYFNQDAVYFFNNLFKQYSKR